MEEGYNKEDFEAQLKVVKLITAIIFMLLPILALIVISQLVEIAPAQKEVPQKIVSAKLEEPEIVNGVDVATGLIVTDGYIVVKQTCTACHSAKLVTQNKATREGWLDMIRWMQEKQGLWDLGENEPLILDYLEKNYAPKKQGRRLPLNVEEWYMIK